jgi:menaquinone-dependent protoporphyrinogen IX oxidase
MSGSIPVAYTARRCLPQEVAKTIICILRGSVLEVDIRPVREVRTLDDYDAVVLYAAICSTRRYANAQQFLSQHPIALARQRQRDAKACRQLDRDPQRYP